MASLGLDSLTPGLPDGGTRCALERLMPDLPDLLTRTRRFALASLTFFDRLPKATKAQVLGKQYLEAATSVASNYRAARRGRSRAEFIAKLGTVVEEADECVGWLELMQEGNVSADPELLSEARQLCAIFTTSLQTARRNHQAREKERKRNR